MRKMSVRNAWQKKGRGSRGRGIQLSERTVERAAAVRQSMVRPDLIDDDSDDDSDDFSANQSVLSRTLQLYREVLDDDPVESPLSYAGPISCLICLSAVHRSDATWACTQCYCVFHLHCIQAWARDGVKGYKNVLPLELFPNQDCFWSCPKCRRDYPKKEIPTKYLCYCGTNVDPPVDAWLLPHSCGEVCGRRLPSLCQHTCLSLCHPGPCPPCPKTASVACFCGKGSPQVKRCGAQGWSCGRICGRVLSCGLHTCEEPCHHGGCGLCTEVVLQRCRCGKETKDRSCDSPVWSCDKQCRRSLPCGNHLCEQVCHSGDCGECPRTGPRTCPCGKTEHVLPCLEEIPPCGDTCNKVMVCGVHKCQRLCHTGDCGQCIQAVTKACRCGKKTKSLVCFQEFFCESKCQKMRDCGNHMCKRKCCNGLCPSCEQVCSKQLGCRNHKCQAPCHRGHCYPCVLTAVVYCYCRASKIVVSCGREKQTKPPKCRELCTIPSSCNHPHRKPHNCHPPPCPPCRLVCGLPLSCGHSCGVTCHSTPKLPQQNRPAGLPPWVKLADPPSGPVVDPCPPCQHPVDRQCKGNHENVIMACSEVRDFSCGRKCGRQLDCKNHSCSRGCHLVINAPGPGLAGEDCLQCENDCLRPRPPGCSHSCTLPCHPGDCPGCEVLVRKLCHCKTLPILIKCYEWCAADSRAKDDMICCNSQCTQMMSCGHRCPLTCHVGDCADPAYCNKKLTVRCPCGRIKKESRCSVHKTIDCDGECERIKIEKKQARLSEEHKRREQKLREEKEADEALQRQLRPRKRKRKPRMEIEETAQPSLFSKYQTTLIVVCAMFCLALSGLGVWFMTG